MDDVKRLKTILNEIKLTNSLDYLCTQIKWLLIRASQRYYPDTVGYVSKPVSLFYDSRSTGERIIKRYIDVPPRIAHYYEILNDSTVSSKTRLVNLYLALSKDKKVQHLNRRDEWWDDIETALNKPLPPNSSFFSKGLNKVTSFDNSLNPYVKPAAEYFSRKYKDSFSFIEGSSLTEVPKYHQENPKEKFDLVYINGSSAYENILTDIINARNLAHVDALLWVNNFHSDDVRQAVLECTKKGIVKIVDVHTYDAIEQYCWVEAQYMEEK